MTPESERGARESNSRGPELAAAVVFTRVCLTTTAAARTRWCADWA
jgi:hypothetical protein